MINELFGNYVNVLGFRIIMILVFIVTVIDLLVRANHRMKRGHLPFKAPRIWVALIGVASPAILYIRNINFELIHINYGILDMLLAYTFDIIVIVVTMVVYAKLITIITFIMVSLAFELTPTVNKNRVLRRFYAKWSLRKSILRA